MRINDLEIKAAGPTIWLHWHQMGVPIPTTIQMTREEAEHVAMSLLMAARGTEPENGGRPSDGVRTVRCIQTSDPALAKDVQALNNLVEADAEFGSSKIASIVKGDCVYATIPYGGDRAACVMPCGFNSDAELDRMLADCGELARRYAVEGITDVRVLVKRGGQIKQVARYGVA